MRNLWANNTGRNPSIGWNGVFNFVNNVIFNWMHRSVDGGDYSAKYNIINNYYKPGPVTPVEGPVSHRLLKPESGRSQLSRKVYGMAFVHGNVVEGNEIVTNDNWNGGVQIEDLPDAGDHTNDIRSKSPLAMPDMTIMDANEAYDFVLENAGATLPKRDPVDERITRVVKTGVIEYAENVNLDGIPKFEHRRLPDDSYKLGIITVSVRLAATPSTTARLTKIPTKMVCRTGGKEKYGLNPNDPSDARGDINGDGYMNIEKFINGINPETNIDWTNSMFNYDTLKVHGNIHKQ